MTVRCFIGPSFKYHSHHLRTLPRSDLTSPMCKLPDESLYLPNTAVRNTTENHAITQVFVKVLQKVVKAAIVNIDA